MRRGDAAASGPMRDLPKSSAALLAMAPQAYGDPTPIDFGADDRGSRAAQAAFEKITGGAIVHEPALDLVAAVLGRAYSEAPQAQPANSLVQWVYWRCGAESLPGPSNVLVAQEGLEQAFEPHLTEAVNRLPKSNAVPMTYGLVRLAVPGGSLQAIADWLPRAGSRAPGEEIRARRHADALGRAPSGLHAAHRLHGERDGRARRGGARAGWSEREHDVHAAHQARPVFPAGPRGRAAAQRGRPALEPQPVLGAHLRRRRRARGAGRDHPQTPQEPPGPERVALPDPRDVQRRAGQARGARRSGSCASRR